MLLGIWISLGGGFVSIPHIMWVIFVVLFKFFAPFTSTKPEDLAEKILFCLFTLCICLTGMVIFFQFLMQNVKQKGKIRWQAAFCDRVINCVPVGIIGVRLRQTGRTARYSMANDESAEGPSALAGRYEVAFSNVLADKMFVGPPEKHAQTDEEKTGSRAQAKQAITNEDLDKAMFNRQTMSSYVSAAGTEHSPALSVAQLVARHQDLLYDKATFFTRDEENNMKYFEVTFTSMEDVEDDSDITMVFLKDVTSQVESAGIARDLAV